MSSLALIKFAFWNKHALSLRSEGPIRFMTRQLTARIPEIPTGVDLSGQTVLITGGNAGVGLEAARTFLQLGADVILAVRNLVKGETARTSLLKTRPDANVTVREVDMASFESIKNFSTKLEEDGVRVDIAILNAGTYEYNFRKSVHGYEMQLQVRLWCIQHPRTYELTLIRLILWEQRFSVCFCYLL